jgi:hypothetical protein
LGLPTNTSYLAAVGTDWRIRSDQVPEAIAKLEVKCDNTNNQSQLMFVWLLTLLKLGLI